MASASRPFVEWIGSEPGKKFLLGATTAVSGFAGFLYWVPSAPAIDKTKDTLQMYHDGLPVRPPPRMIQLISEVLGDCGVAPLDANRMRWFTCFGFEPIHMGQVSFRKGAILGLPKPYYYEHVDEIDRSQIKLSRNKTLPWRSEAGQALKEALVLSEEAKKFVIAREIHETCSGYVWTKLLCISLPVPFITTAAAYINELARLKRRPWQIRLAVNSLFGFLALSVSVSTFQYFTRYYEQDADEEVAKMGEDYARGGVEFYGKTLLRNRALRELLGEDGAKSYDIDGDVIHWFMQPHLPFAERRKTCQTELDKQVKARENPQAEAKEEGGKKGQKSLTRPTTPADILARAKEIQLASGTADSKVLAQNP